jgi:hypothetical protein
VKTPQTEADSSNILEALSHGIAGDDDTAWGILQPIVRRSDATMFATLCTLAEAAAFDALQTQKPGEHFGLQVDDIHTGTEGSAEDLPPGIRFAAQFVTARANRDEDTADALYRALYMRDPENLAVGFRTVYEMAVVSLRAFCERKRTEGGR